MAAYIDFHDLKTRVSISQVVQMLGLRLTTKGDQSRGACPQCQSGGDRALAINADGRFSEAILGCQARDLWPPARLCYRAHADHAA